MKPRKVLALTRYGREGSSSRLRFLQLVPALGAAGLDVTVRALWDERYLRGFYAGERAPPAYVAARYLRRLGDVARLARAHDVLWLEAELLPYVPAVVEVALARLGIPYVVDYDDAVGHKYDRRIATRALLGKKIDHVMRGAAAVVAGNPYVAGLARKAGAERVEVVPTVVDVARYPLGAEPRVPSAGAPLRVGWIGTPETQRYLRVVAAALRAASERMPVVVVAVGAAPDVASSLPGVRVERRAWSEATEGVDVASFDIGIMPLPDEPWERGKSAYKLIQCMACARPVIASPVGVNAEVVGDAGLLASTTTEWADALLALARDPGRRAAMGAAGRARVEERYSLDAAAPPIIALLSSAGGARA